MENYFNDRYKHRMGEKAITLQKADGTKLANTEITVKQTKHHFLFGCAAFDSIPLANNELDGEKKELTEEIFNKFFRLFNFVTLPFYWARFEPVQGKPDTQRVRKAAEWLISKGCKLKGHPLCWHTLTAPWLLDLKSNEILQMQVNRIRRDVANFTGLVDTWDVINEVVIMPAFDKYDNGITRLCKDLGRIRLVREVFQAAKRANPNAVLLINDFETSESYEILIEGCLEAGIPIDAIGIQSHMHQGYWGVEKTLEILERFSRFKLPVHFTENTIVSGQLMPPEIVDLNDYVVDSWPTTADGEERQAKELVLHYKTLFAHPSVESITYWNFTDGGWLNAPAGLLRGDGTVKPSYEEIDKLINNEWWTGEKTYVTDEAGSFTVSGFLGDYEIYIRGNLAGSFQLLSDNRQETVTIKSGRGN
ncbi:MAG TPA: endo-1,4-beta-xylanase [Thermoclostridium sp.]